MKKEEEEEEKKDLVRRRNWETEKRPSRWVRGWPPLW